MAFFSDSARQTIPRWILVLLRLVVGPMGIGTG